MQQIFSDSASISCLLSPILNDCLCFPAGTDFSSWCSLTDLQPLDSPSVPCLGQFCTSCHASCSYGASWSIFLICSMEDQIQKELRFRSPSKFKFLNHIKNILVSGDHMPLWLWAVSTSNLNWTEPSKWFDVQHHCKNEMAVGEVVSSWDFSLKIKLK